jgi:hypothetical protein
MSFRKHACAALRSLTWLALAALQMSTAASFAEPPGPGSKEATAEEIAAPAVLGVRRDTDWWSARLETTLSADDELRRFWAPRLAMLFDGIELTADQLAGIDALLADAQDDRLQVKALMIKLEEARARGDETRAGAIEKSIGSLRTELRPTRRMERLATVLDADQQSTYHLNRAQIFRRSRRPGQ